MPKTGVVFILNGTSSSGKTTLAKELQQQFEEVYLHCSSDMFWNMTPHGIPASSKTFPNLKQAMAQSVRALAVTGHNVIVDTVYQGAKSHLEMQKVLQGVSVTTVKVACDLEELNKREIARGNRKIGLAASQFHTVHEYVPYDIVINTADTSPEACVSYIIDQFSINKD